MRLSLSTVLRTTLLASLALPLSLKADVTWNFSHGPTAGDGNTWSYTSGGYTVTATAWADTRESSNPDSIQNAELDYWNPNGLGVRNRNGGNEDDNCCQHSMDNIGDYDFILFQFKDSTSANQAVTVKNVDLGWLSQDSDLTVLAYTDPTASSAVNPFNASGGADLWGESISSLTNANSGWSRFDLAGNGSNSSLAPRDVGTSVTSSWWIVGASFNGSDRDDYTKLAALTANIPSGGGGGGGSGGSSVPAPASILMIAGGLPLIRRFRGQQSK